MFGRLLLIKIIIFMSQLFNYNEFGIIKNEAGSNNFVLSTKNG